MGHKTIGKYELSTGRYAAGDRNGKIATLHIRESDELTEAKGFIQIR